MSETLLNCPFCGSGPRRDDTPMRYVFQCKGCPLRFAAGTLGELIAMWNRRAPQPPESTGEERVWWEKAIRECLDHVLTDNVPALRSLLGPEDKEARCREMAALYLYEMLELRWLKQRSDELDGVEVDIRKAFARAGVLIEAARVGESTGEVERLRRVLRNLCGQMIISHGRDKVICLCCDVVADDQLHRFTHDPECEVLEAEQVLDGPTGKAAGL